jgi:cytochrome b561
MTEPSRFTWLSRLLHWLTAALVFAALSIGFVMVNSVASYAQLLVVHKTLGALILVVVLVRVVNRLTHRPPPLPSTVGSLEHKAVVLSELSLYAMLLAQPLLGWAMVSAAGEPVVVFDALRLPRIAPSDAQLFWVLRQAHSVVAYLLMATIAAHIAAVLLHTLTLRDRLIERMTFRFRSKARRSRA